MMTQEARQKRIAAVKLSRAVNAIEGVPLSTYALNLQNQWARGEITSEQMKSKLLASHKEIAEKGSKA